jgi:cytochrome P450
MLLAHDPALRCSLVEEITGVTGGGTPTVEQALAMPLLDRVIKETLRILPPAVYALRLTAHDTELAGIPVRKGNAVVISHFISHRLPDVFPDPDRFDPSRWERDEPTPYAYIPFSAGPRMCIGAAFANLEMRVILATLLPAVQITPLAPVDTATNGAILHAKGDVPVRIDSAAVRLPAWQIRGTLADIVG